ncbi:MAG: preQ(1) synthase [Rhodospirillaceae bacterium]|jgi:7-cyano-7-deazaguanine reductase|nr:preQ(1) synthase [Rhodospirillaceae bacterium]
MIEITYENLTQLGSSTTVPISPDQAVLEKVCNPHLKELYLVRFIIPEFTSLCPITHQPDFANFVIDYVPYEFLIESKSLKLFIASFRNYGIFHEDCTVRIGKRLVDVLSPKWLRIGGYWFPRGGIPINIFWQTGAKPNDLWIPPVQEISPYHGR